MLDFQLEGTNEIDCYYILLQYYCIINHNHIIWEIPVGHMEISEMGQKDAKAAVFLNLIKTYKDRTCSWSFSTSLELTCS